MIYLIAGILLILSFVALLLIFLNLGIITPLVFGLIFLMVGLFILIVGIMKIKLNSDLKAEQIKQEILKEDTSFWLNEKSKKKENKIAKEVDEIIKSEPLLESQSKEYYLQRLDLLKQKHTKLNDLYEACQEKEDQLVEEYEQGKISDKLYEEKLKEFAEDYELITNGFNAIEKEAKQIQNILSPKKDRAKAKSDSIIVPDRLKEVIAKHNKIISKNIDELNAMARYVYKEGIAQYSSGLDLAENIEEFASQTKRNFRTILEHINDPDLTGDIIIGFSIFVDCSKRVLKAQIKGHLLGLQREKLKDNKDYQLAVNKNSQELEEANTALDAIYEKMEFALKRVSFELYLMDLRIY